MGPAQKDDKPFSLHGITEKELHQQTLHFDTIVVFGEGPIKPVLLQEELTPEQQVKWKHYRQNSSTVSEPNFFVIERETSLLKLSQIDQNDKITQAEKEQFKEHVRTQWQHNGWIALKRMGRQNALAAGYALYKGITSKIILSGGKTIAVWAKESLPKKRLENWPSEALLMKDLIMRTYGSLYEKKYGKSIEDVIVLEDKATNTLENFAFTLNKDPNLLSEDTQTGFISARHHLKRLEVLAQIFSISQSQQCHLAAQELLHAAIYTDKQEYGSDFDFIADEKNYSETKEQHTREACWISALEDPQYVTYWLGYIADVKNPKVLQKTVKKLQAPKWFGVAKEVFSQIGLNLDELVALDMSELYQSNKEQYALLLESIKKLKSPQYRKMPPSPIPVPRQVSLTH